MALWAGTCVLGGAADGVRNWVWFEEDLETKIAKRELHRYRFSAEEEKKQRASAREDAREDAKEMMTISLLVPGFGLVILLARTTYAAVSTVADALKLGMDDGDNLQ